MDAPNQESTTTTPRKGRVRLRLEQWAKNPQCEANLVSAIRDVDMAKVAKAFGIAASSAPSELAVRNGRFFEQLLFRDGADLLLGELKALRNPPLTDSPTPFLDFRLVQDGGPSLHHVGEVVERSEELLATLASLSRDAELPASLVAGLSVRIPESPPMPEALYTLDALAIRVGAEAIELTVGEVKDYPDRDGFTDGQGLSTARIQAGAYIFALEHCIERLGLGERLRVRQNGFIVLTKPGQAWPSVLPNEDLRHQAERARIGFERARGMVAQLPPEALVAEPTMGNEGLRAFFTNLNHQYGPNCAAFCPMADECHRALLEWGDPLALGAEAKELLGDIAIPRVAALLDGAEPAGSEEANLMDWLRILGLAAER